MIPFVDLKRQYQGIKHEIDAAIRSILDSTQFVLGEELDLFEKEFAAYCGVKSAIGVANGTDALLLALLASEVGAGDEVITTPNTFIATAEAISHAGARPVFVDINPGNYNLDPSSLRVFLEENGVWDEETGFLKNKNSGRTIRALIPVHLYGQPAEMDEIMGMAKQYRLRVIEDACQAHGAEYKGRKAGSLGDAGCFSFYPGKNLGAYGDGGMVVTNDDAVAEKIRRLRDHGKVSKFEHNLIGYNSRLDCFQAAILRVKLRKLDQWNEERIKNAETYHRLLEDERVVTPQKRHPDLRHIYHLYVIGTKARSRIMERFAQDRISCGIHYPVPIHLTAAYRHLLYGKGSFPRSESCADEIISLPMFPELTESEILRVCESVQSVLREE